MSGSASTRRLVALQQLGEIVETRCYVRVIGAERLFVDGEGAAVERLGLGVAGTLISGNRQSDSAGVTYPQRICREPLMRLAQACACGSSRSHLFQFANSMSGNAAFTARTTCSAQPRCSSFFMLQRTTACTVR